MAYSPTQWETVRAFYERGLSLSEIAGRPEVEIKDRKSISRKANQEGWIKGEKATLVEREVKVKQEIAEITTEKATKNATELNVHNLLVSEYLEKTKYYDTNQRLLSKVVMHKVKQTMPQGVPTDETTTQLLLAASNVLTSGRQGETGKTTDIAVQIINNQQNISDFPHEQRLKQIYAESLQRSTERSSKLTGRMQRLGIVIDQSEYDGD